MKSLVTLKALKALMLSAIATATLTANSANAEDVMIDIRTVPAISNLKISYYENLMPTIIDPSNPVPPTRIVASATFEYLACDNVQFNAVIGDMRDEQTLQLLINYADADGKKCALNSAPIVREGSVRLGLNESQIKKIILTLNPVLEDFKGIVH